MTTIYLDPSSDQDTKYLEDFLGNNMDDPLVNESYNNPFDKPNFGYNNRQWVFEIQSREDRGPMMIGKYPDEDIEIRELTGCEKGLRLALNRVYRHWDRIESGGLSDGVDSIVLRYQKPTAHPQD